MGLVSDNIEKAVTLDPCIYETAEGNLTKIGRGGQTSCQNLCANLKKSSGGFSQAHTQHVHRFWGFINQGTAQTSELILTNNVSKEPVWAKEVLSVGQKF